jgi:dolichol kinase
MFGTQFPQKIVHFILIIALKFMLTSYTKEQKIIDVSIYAILMIEVKVIAGNVPLVSYPLITNLYKKQVSLFVRHSEIDYNFNEIFIVQNQLHH